MKKPAFHKKAKGGHHGPPPHMGGHAAAPTEPQAGLVPPSAPGVGPDSEGDESGVMVTCPGCGDSFDAVQALSQHGRGGRA